MKNIPKLIPLLAAVAGLGIGSAHGTTFDYSYVFGDGLTISGSLDGTQNGLFVEDVSNVTLFFNGVQTPGSVYQASFLDGLYLSDPVISFDAMQNNFFFADTDLAGGDFGYNSIFYLLNGSADSDAAFALSYPLDYFGSQDAPAVAGNWSLTASAVPDRGSNLAMLALAILGLLVVQRVHSARLALCRQPLGPPRG
jgi:hypothetical protein